MRLIFTILLLLGAAPAFAGDWKNGDLQGRQFIWSNGGGDPYQGTLDNALQLAGIENSRVRNLLVNAVSANPQGNAPQHIIRDGDRLGVMVSGSEGWVARNPVAQSSTWISSRSRIADVWYVLDPETGVQYRLMKARVCGNWLIKYFGAPERCRCEINDAC